MATPGIYECPQCGEMFYAPTKRWKWCSAKRRFFSNTKRDAASGCLVWQRAPSPSGYGQFTVGSSTDGTKDVMLAHRYAWEIGHGELASDVHIDHKVCRNKMCVEVLHMVPGTLLDNIMQPDGGPSINAAKTHCRRGHPYSDDNTRVAKKSDGKVGRACITCSRAHARAQRECAAPPPLRRTHCRNGHPCVPENLFISGPRRECRACMRASRERRDAKKNSRK